MQASESIISVCFNSSLLKYGGDVAVGAMTILTSVMQFAMLPLQGLGQGAQPIMSYNYGAKESDRVRKIYLMTFEIVVGIMAVGTVICFVVPQTLMSMFTNNPETLTEGAIALRIICAGFYSFFRFCCFCRCV